MVAIRLFSEAFEMGSRRMAHGLTLVELMVTVALIAILVLVTIPPVMQAVQKREVVNASRSVVDIVEFARVQAAARNRAYRITPFLASGGEANGRLVVVEGHSPACIGFNSPGPDGNPALTVRVFDLTSVHPGVRLSAVEPSDLTAAPLCVKPDGRVFQVRGDTSPVIIPGTGTFAGGDATLRLQRFNSLGSPEGPIHSVRIPFNGMARVVVE
jgi:prepilin-type N-terminal cleavage/methylation domain-containing protein